MLKVLQNNKIFATFIMYTHFIFHSTTNVKHNKFEQAVHKNNVGRNFTQQLLIQIFFMEWK